MNRESHLSPEWNISLRKLYRQSFLVNRFQESTTKLLMNFDCGADDGICSWIILGEFLHHRFWSFPICVICEICGLSYGYLFGNGAGGREPRPNSSGAGSVDVAS